MTDTKVTQINNNLLVVTKEGMGSTAYLLDMFVTTVGEGEALEQIVTVCYTSNIYGGGIMTSC